MMKRIRLLSDYTEPGPCGSSFKAGQLGRVIGGEAWNGCLAIDFDGYEEHRATNTRMIAESGEGFNIVPWQGCIPVELLEDVE